MKEVWHKIKNFFGNMSIQTKFIAMTISLVFLSVTLLTLYFYNVSTGLILDNSRRYIQNTMEQIGKNIDYNLDAVERVMFDISTDHELQADMRIVNQNVLDSYEAADLGRNIKNNLISQITKVTAIRAAFLYTLDGTSYITKDGDYHNPAAIPLEPVYEAKGGNVWFDTDEALDVIPVAKEINSLTTQKPLGHLILYVDRSYIEDVFENVRFTTNDQIFLMNGNGQGIMGEVPDRIPKEIKTSLVGQDKIEKLKISSSVKQVYLVPLEHMEWTLVSISEDDRYNAQLKNLQRITILLFSAILLGITILSILVARGISRPIKMLVEAMKQFSTGDFTVYASVKYKDEIGRLRDSFNHMVSDMESLVNNVYEEKNLKQQAQIKALRMQINPHFLYNTLDTIHWMAQMHHEEDIARVTQSLGYLMRFSLKEQDLISFEEELDAVEHYICIQKYRYTDLKIILDVEEEVLYEDIPCHIMMPMIENAIEHGLSDKSGDKLIHVWARLEGGVIHIKIEDNGRGIEPEKIAQIVKGHVPENSDQHMSIGIQNVDRRLKLKYGAEYGVHVTSEPGMGTCIEIIIPTKEEEHEINNGGDVL